MNMCDFIAQLEDYVNEERQLLHLAEDEALDIGKAKRLKELSHFLGRCSRVLAKRVLSSEAEGLATLSDKVDEASWESFPASDPPNWTP